MADRDRTPAGSIADPDAVKMADEQWKHGEGPATPTVVLGAEP